jgi:hypothetical protein
MSARSFIDDDAPGMPSTESDQDSRQNDRRECFMDRSNRLRRRAVARDVLRAMRRTERTRSEARTPTDGADEVIVAIEDYKASPCARKLKEPPVN